MLFSQVKRSKVEFQQVGMDEAYLELTETCENFNNAKTIAEKIQIDILEKVGITISIGIAHTKSLAKIASDFKKPNGITLFEPETYKEYLKNLDITRVPGIGKKSKVYFYNQGIKTIGDIITISLPKFMELFGKHGEWVWKVANGFDNRKVMEFHEGRKSISKERTFFKDSDSFNEVLSRLEDINDKIHKSVKKHHITYKTISLKIRFQGFETYIRSKTLPFHIQDKNKVMEIILKLYHEFSKKHKKVRLIGIKLSNLEKNSKVFQTDIRNFAINHKV